MSASLQLTGLTKVFDTPSGPFIAVKDVNAGIRDGEFVAILGHSGCGKSTVLSIIAGLERPTFGGVVVDGSEVLGPDARRAIVFQSPCLLPWLTAKQNVQLAADRSASSRAHDDIPHLFVHLDPLFATARPANPDRDGLSVETQHLGGRILRPVT